MRARDRDAAVLDAAAAAEAVTEVRRVEAALKTGALQKAILNSANFSSIATDEKGVINCSTSAPSACSATRPPR
jgi:hypothetical protein